MFSPIVFVGECVKTAVIKERSIANHHLVSSVKKDTDSSALWIFTCDVGISGKEIIKLCVGFRVFAGFCIVIADPHFH
jgi:hypothetical protein